MIITCPYCEKKFEIDQKLIPSEGRMLQCGSCDHKWFFKINVVENKNDEKINTETEKDLKTNSPQLNKVSLKKDITGKDELVKNEIKTKNKISFFNIFLVIIISVAALIVILDTFKDNLETLFPNIKFLLNNLYQSIEDIKLFILDLIK
tara:strand:+ start:103 stop:549 length:447 start_codon:yes stop_codon:yes gene_type:complete